MARRDRHSLASSPTPAPAAPNTDRPGDHAPNSQLGSWSYNIASEAMTWSDGFRTVLGLCDAGPPSVDLFLDRIDPCNRPHIAHALQSPSPCAFDELLRFVQSVHRDAPVRTSGSDD